MPNAYNLCISKLIWTLILKNPNWQSKKWCGTALTNLSQLQISLEYSMFTLLIFPLKIAKIRSHNTGRGWSVISTLWLTNVKNMPTYAEFMIFIYGSKRISSRKAHCGNSWTHATTLWNGSTTFIGEMWITGIFKRHIGRIILVRVQKRDSYIFHILRK